MTAPQGQEEYVRTTFEVEEWYCAGDISDEDRQQLRGEFRAWLAEHDAEVAARAWDEATYYDVARQVVIACETGDDQPVNPYRQEGDR